MLLMIVLCLLSAAYAAAYAVFTQLQLLQVLV